MYKLKTEVQNNHGINFRLVGIMQDWWSKEADWQIVWFCQGGLTGRARGVPIVSFGTFQDWFEENSLYGGLTPTHRLTAGSIKVEI